MPPALKLAVTVDVEEEGLFTGRFPPTPAGLDNVAHLDRLLFITREFGFPLTLLSTYRVAENLVARRFLLAWRDRHGAELGAHLHHWNTPPLETPHGPQPVRLRRLPVKRVAEKLANLMDMHARAFGEGPQSFRMGRFDWNPGLLQLLPGLGFRVDSSMVPLTQVIGGPDHFLAPADPFWVSLGDSPFPDLLEAPLTLVPFFPRVARAIYRFSARFPGALGHLLRCWFPFVGAAGIQPVWFPSAWMRLAVHHHLKRGGGVLTLFLHSSELMPGGTPHVPSEQAVQRLLEKLKSFFTWLTNSHSVEGVTLTRLYGQIATGGLACPVRFLTPLGLDPDSGVVV